MHVPIAEKTILVCGVQKSGTTLMHRQLQTIPRVLNPVSGEGANFWGDSPPFAPVMPPTGSVFQSRGGVNGHVIEAADFTREQLELLNSRIANFSPSAVWCLKNPYNSVRLEWCRKMFPSAHIVACVRHPCANVFSLLKKFFSHPGRGLPPALGWWGVKPRNWQQFLRADKVTQLALQWNAVHELMLDHADCVDTWVVYHDFCRDPAAHIGKILGSGFDLRDIPNSIRSDDLQFTRGARLMSRNRSEDPGHTDYRLGPLSTAQQQLINEITAANWQRVLHISRSQNLR
jgi:hypothetical protein